MSAIETLLARGYFPKELPPPFDTQSFAKYMATNAPAEFSVKTGRRDRSSNFVSLPGVHNLARSGSLRRKLSIPNPVNFYQQALAVSENWREIRKHCRDSKISLTSPTYSSSHRRPIAWKSPFSILPRARASTRAGARYSLVTDIASFYPSIYTHSIPWALHGKDAAKRSRTDLTLTGNLLDLVVRNGQDMQTMGVPIGPDTSIVFSEIVLSAIDEKLKPLGTKGFRFVDDIEFGFRTLSEAEWAMALLQESASEMELQLNASKSRIVELPAPLEAVWAPHLRMFSFRTTSRGQATDLLGYFSRAFELAATHRQESVLMYTLSRMSSVTVALENWKLYEDLLLQCAAVDPSTVSPVVRELYKYSSIRSLDLGKIGDCMAGVVLGNAAAGHGSEVAWAIWAMLSLNIPIEEQVCAEILKMKDSVVALLLLHARHKGLTAATVDFSRWQKLLNTQELNSECWLLAYEANFRGWLPPLPGVGDYVSSHPQFALLKANGVSFYDTNASMPSLKVAVLVPPWSLDSEDEPDYPDAAPDEYDEDEEEDEDEDEGSGYGW